MLARMKVAPDQVYTQKIPKIQKAYQEKIMEKSTSIKKQKKKKKIVTKKKKYQMGGSTSGNSNIKPEKEYEIEEGGRDE